MLSGRMFMAAAASAAVSRSFLGSAVDTTDVTTYTFSSKTLGAAAANRHIVVGVQLGAASRYGVSVTVAGVNAVLAIRSEVSGVASELWIAPVPTGTTGDIVVTLSGASSRCGIGWWRMLGAFIVPTDTLATTANPGTGTIDVAARGALFANVYTQVSSGTVSWTGPTEDFDEALEVATQSGASEEYAAAQSGLTVTATPSSAGATAMTAAAWGATIPSTVEAGSWNEGSGTNVSVGSGVELGFRFQAPCNMTVTQVQIAKGTGGTSDTLSTYFFSDDGAANPSPATLLSTSSDTQDMTANESKTWTHSQALTAGTWYWVVLEGPSTTTGFNTVPIQTKWGSGQNATITAIDATGQEPKVSTTRDWRVSIIGTPS